MRRVLTLSGAAVLLLGMYVFWSEHRRRAQARDELTKLETREAEGGSPATTRAEPIRTDATYS